MTRKTKDATAHTPGPGESRLRLIAAAPDLLDALRDLVEAFPAGDDGMEVAGSFGADAELSYARTILDQLEGEHG